MTGDGVPRAQADVCCAGVLASGDRVSSRWGLPAPWGCREGTGSWQKPRRPLQPSNSPVDLTLRNLAHRKWGAPGHPAMGDENTRPAGQGDLCKCVEQQKQAATQRDLRVLKPREHTHTHY